ncbi:virulence RhuM family protein [Segatella copri]|uniref:virulence RhuM family protein n=1 Tax=Segatella copri TaxID=165179 RepID=UPI001934482B|nr:RhuM family protein [Segatella copri]MBM0129437.1 DNA-binding protein [Segatella copri]
MANDNNIQPVADDSQIVLYQPNESVKLEVKVDAGHETVWLTQQQIADLFGTKRPAITKHLSNIYASGELDKNSTCSILEHMGNDSKQRYATTYYNLDAIISVGYRVNSINATAFRRWATNVLRDYLLQGYSVNRHLIALQENMDKRMTHIEDIQAKQQQQLDFFIRTSTPPAEMVFFEGDFYTARVALENLVRSANHRVIIIDGYVSSLTLSVLDVRKPEVSATVYTVGVGQGMQRLMDEHDRLFPDNHIDIRKWRNESHDRWLIIDDSLYHCGHSLNANGGHKISAITLMGTSLEVILSKVE